MPRHCRSHRFYGRIQHGNDSDFRGSGQRHPDHPGLRQFPGITLGAGKTVKIHTGKGTNTSANRYWNQSWYVWNNSGGDSATLRTPSSAFVDKCAWGTVTSYVNC